MPLTGVTTSRWKYSGTISTSPPTAIVRMTRTISSGTLCSILSCVSFIMASPSGSGMRDGRRYRRIDRLAFGDGLEHVPSHQEHAAQIQQAANESDHVERIGRLHALDERVGERAVLVDRAPHQSLHHAGDPHRSDVDDDAYRCHPEVRR